MNDTTRDLSLGLAAAAVVGGGAWWAKNRKPRTRTVDHVTQLRLDSDAAGSLPGPDAVGDVQDLLDHLPSLDDLGLPAPTSPGGGQSEVTGIELPAAPFTPSRSSAPTEPAPGPGRGVVSPPVVQVLNDGSPPRGAPKGAYTSTPTPDLAVVSPSSPALPAAGGEGPPPIVSAPVALPAREPAAPVSAPPKVSTVPVVKIKSSPATVAPAKKTPAKTEPAKRPVAKK